MMARDLLSRSLSSIIEYEDAQFVDEATDPTRESGETPNIDRVVTGMYLSTSSDTSDISVCSVNRSLRILFRWAFSR